jgi:hypothetical protein
VVGRGIDPRTSRFQVGFGSFRVPPIDMDIQEKVPLDGKKELIGSPSQFHADSPCFSFVWARCGHEDL